MATNDEKVTNNPETSDTIITEDDVQKYEQQQKQTETKEFSIQQQQSNTESTKDSNKSTTKSPTSPPTMLAGKYKTEEELQKGIFELLKKTTGSESLEDIYKTLEKGDLGTKVKPKDTNNTKEESTLDLGVIDNYLNDYLSKGALDEKALDELSKQLNNAPKELINAALEGRKAQLENYTKTLTSIVGDEKQFQQILDWGKKVFSKEEQQAFDTIMASLDINAASLVLKGIKALYESNNPKLISDASTESSISTTGETFSSVEDLMKAVTSDEYINNSKYRATIDAKIKRSNIDLKDLW